MTQIAVLPKVDLHCHLDGSLNIAFVENALVQLGESALLPQLTQLLQAPPHCTSLAQYLECFDLPIRCMQTAAQVQEAAYSFAQGLLTDNICYIEVRFSPALLENSSMTQRQALESVLAGLAVAEKDFGITSRVILCAMRHHSNEQNLATYHLAREYLGYGLCGVDLAGDEAVYPNHGFAELFTTAKRLGLPYTIHAGECGSTQSIQDAIAMGASRIGHGIAMRGNDALQQLCAQKRVGVELCPTSNLQTKAVASMEDYPFQEFVSNGVLVTVNTDNRTVSDTTIGREFALLTEKYALTNEQINQLTENAIFCSFAEDNVKDRLLKLL